MAVYTELEDRVQRLMGRARRESHTEGRRVGRRAGLAQGIEDERKLLLRMAARRFGVGTAARLVPLVAHVAEPERLERVGEWLFNCADGEELIARFGDSADHASPHRQSAVQERADGRDRGSAMPREPR